jgi:hypothetical protein
MLIQWSIKWARIFAKHKLEENEVEASNYMRLIHPLLFGPHCDRRFILNMNQMPVYFLMSTKRMLELAGKKTSLFAHRQTIQGVQPWL